MKIGKNENNNFVRKDKPVGTTFGDSFVWSEAIDAAADVYNGVMLEMKVDLISLLTQFSLFSGPFLLPFLSSYGVRALLYISIGPAGRV